jgi:hypothetical protein
MSTNKKWTVADWYIDPRRDDRFDSQHDGNAQATPHLTADEMFRRWNETLDPIAIDRWVDDGGQNALDGANP